MSRFGPVGRHDRERPTSGSTIGPSVHSQRVSGARREFHFSRHELPVGGRDPQSPGPGGSKGIEKPDTQCSEVDPGARRVRAPVLSVPGAALAKPITVNTLLDADVADGAVPPCAAAIEAANSDAPPAVAVRRGKAAETRSSFLGDRDDHPQLEHCRRSPTSLTIKGPGRDQLTVDGALRALGFPPRRPGSWTA